MIETSLDKLPVSWKDVPPDITDSIYANLNADIVNASRKPLQRRDFESKMYYLYKEIKKTVDGRRHRSGEEVLEEEETSTPEARSGCQEEVSSVIMESATGSSD